MMTGMRMGPSIAIISKLGYSGTSEGHLYLSNVSELDTCLYQPWLQRALARYTCRNLSRVVSEPSHQLHPEN